MANLCIGGQMAVLNVIVAPTGTYKFVWNGNHPTGTNYGWTDSGVGTSEGTLTGALIATDYGQTGYGLQLNAGNERLQFTVATNDLISDTQGTIWLSLYIGSNSSNSYIVEVYVDANNFIAMSVNYSARTVTGAHKGSGGTTVAVTSTDVVSLITWTRVGYAWSNSDGKHAIKIGAGAWKEETEAIDVFNSAITNLKIGELNMGSIGGEYWIDNFYVTAGYKDADPL